MNANKISEARGFIHALEKLLAKAPLQIDTKWKKENYIRDWNNARVEMLNHQLALYRKWEGRLQV